MQEYAQDSMTYVPHYRHPDLFFTFTCNLTWDEIQKLLLPGQSPVARHDIIARVFRQKLKSLMDFIVRYEVLDVLSRMTKERIATCAYTNLAPQ